MRIYLLVFFSITMITSCATKKKFIQSDQLVTESESSDIPSESSAIANKENNNNSKNDSQADSKTEKRSDSLSEASIAEDKEENTKVIGKENMVIGDTAYIDPELTKVSNKEREKILEEVNSKEIVMSKDTPTIIQKMGNSRFMLETNQMENMILCPQSMFLRPDFANPVILNSNSATGNIVFSIELNKNYARYIEVAVRGFKNDFLLIESMRDRDGKYLFYGLAWAHISHFATSTKSFGSLNTATLYTYPTADSKIEVQIAGSSVVKVEACQNDWLFVRHYNGSSGWLSPEDNCPSMLSNCN